METYKNIFNLDKKVAVVTGASGILGTEFSKALCALGATVVCLDIEEKALTNLSSTLQNQYGSDKFITHTCNVADQSSIQLVIDQVINQFGKIDILLNNAATKTKDLKDFFTPFAEYSLNAWREVMSVNLDGMFLMAQEVGKHMVKARQGTIIQTASVYSLLGPDQRIYEGSQYLDREINTPAVYTASKAGVIGLTKHLAALWGSYGVRVNALCPGGVESGQNDVFSQKYSARVPLGRMAKQMDIVGPMLFLAGEASSYVTGQVLFADGGLSAW